MLNRTHVLTVAQRHPAIHLHLLNLADVSADSNSADSSAFHTQQRNAATFSCEILLHMLIIAALEHLPWQYHALQAPVNSNGVCGGTIVACHSIRSPHRLPNKQLRALLHYVYPLLWW